jgi:hypothetical protein
MLEIEIVCELGLVRVIDCPEDRIPFNCGGNDKEFTEIVKVGAATPIPVSAIVWVGVEPSSVTVSVPFWGPTLVGAKAISIWHEVPGCTAAQVFFS